MPLLRLLRVPGVFTAMADILAGYLLVCFASASEHQPRLLALTLAASACFYMAGMAWNDIFDARQDRFARPDRPLPAGMLTLTTAFAVATILSVAGLLIAMRAGLQPFLVASLLLGAVLLYDAGGKRVEGFGPLVMGLCRGLNLILGMSIHANVFLLLERPAFHLPALFLAVYTAAITALAALEAPARPGGGSAADGGLPGQAPGPDALLQGRGEAAVQAMAIAVLWMVPVCAAFALARHLFARILFGLHLVLLIGPGSDALRARSRAAVRLLVSRAILSIIVFDSALVATATTLSASRPPGMPLHLPSTEHLAGIILVFALALPAMVLQRRIAVT